ncbi:cysteine peptidase family C39 domain-containing protein [Paenibacillus xanthanilyticus]|uniref:Butirosin biosynthesis protein H N-terminal domain-containing protein n=1 Tax=Paenibacillus xanthanilyticus TaxID=1783531 RepID=A0ABV8K5H3_9BACL
MTQPVETVQSLERRVLPFTQPDVYGFLGHAFVLGILQNYEECRPWIHTNYVQMYISQHYIDLNEYRLDFFPDLLIIFGSVPWLEYRQSDKAELKRFNISIHDYIQRQIDGGFYFFSYVDEYYIPFTLAYGEHHFTHDIFIYGYDRAKRVYHYAVFDRNRQFTLRELDFDVFDTAYHADTRQNAISVCRKVAPEEYATYKYDFKIGKYDLDVALMADMLDDYVNARNTSDRLRLYRNAEPGRWGVDVYDALGEYYALLREDRINLDVRQMHNLWEHKKMMLARIGYLQQLGIVARELPYLDAFQRLEQETFKMRNMLLKFFFSRNHAALDKIIASLAVIKQVEREACEQLIADLRRYAGAQT